MSTSASTEPTLSCPHCGKDIKLTESLAAPMLEAAKKEFQQQLATQARAALDAEARARKAEEGAAAERAEAAEKTRQEVQKAVETGRTQAEAFAAQELAVMQGKLGAAQQAQPEALRKSRELDDALREVEATTEK